VCSVCTEMVGCMCTRDHAYVHVRGVQGIEPFLDATQLVEARGRVVDARVHGERAHPAAT
jgi:hypothetical protein